MISAATARELKNAGLTWRPALHDFFVIPERQMDDLVFVISDIQVTVERMQGEQMLSFQGASEWALDSLVMGESIWLPSEEQLRRLLEEALLIGGRPEIRLSGGLGGYRCEVHYRGQPLAFEGAEPSEAYAAALLHLLKTQASQPGKPS